jgi:ketosteroid isomerase-like protein
MRMQTLLLGAAVFSFAACNQSQNGEATSETMNNGSANTVNVDSLDRAFDEGWNKDDSAAIVNSLADDVVFLSGRTKLTGKQAVAENFVHNQMPVTSNLKTDVAQSGSSETVAYSAGTWTLDVNVPGQPTQNVSGNHTFVYKKQADGSWKASLINIEDHDPQTPDSKK